MTLFWKLFGWFRTSLITQIIVGIVAFCGIWKANNVYQQSVGQKKMIEKSNVEAKKKNAKVRKVRRTIKRGGAHKRLHKDFTRSASD